MSAHSISKNVPYSMLEDAAVRQLMHYIRDVRRDVGRKALLLGFGLILAMALGALLYIAIPSTPPAESWIRVESPPLGQFSASDADTEVNILTSLEQFRNTLQRAPFPAAVRVAPYSLAQKISIVLQQLRDPSAPTKFSALTPSLVIDAWKFSQHSRAETLKLVMQDGARYRIFTESGKLLGEATVGERITLADGTHMRVRVSTLFPNQSAIIETRLRNLHVAERQDMTEIEKVGLGVRANLLKLSARSDNREDARFYLQHFVETYMRNASQRNLVTSNLSLEHNAQEIEHLTMRMAEAQAKLETFHEMEGVVQLDEEASLLLRDLSELDRNILGLEQKQSQLQVTLGDNNPALISIRSQLGLLQQERQSMQTSSLRLPLLEQQLFRLTFDLETLKLLYQDALKAQANLQAKRVSTPPLVSLIRPVMVDEPNIRRGIARYSAISGALFFVVFMGGIALRNLPLFLKIKAAHQLYHASFRPTYPQVVRLKSGNLFRSDFSTDASANLAQMARVMKFNGGSKILLTCDLGFNHRHTNFSAYAAQALTENQRVLLIDADIVGKRLTKSLGAAHMPGYVDIITGASSFSGAIQAPSRNQRFHFLPAGNDSPSYRLLANAERQTELFELLSKEFDIILLDIPPTVPPEDVAWLFATSQSGIFSIARGTRLRHYHEALSPLLHSAPENMLQVLVKV